MKRHRNFYKILSIAIAVFLWLYVFIEVSLMTTSTFCDVKVQMENENILESRGLAILSVQPENIDVNVEGKRGNFFQLKHTDILATLDCAELHEGINVVPVISSVLDGEGPAATHAARPTAGRGAPAGRGAYTAVFAPRNRFILIRGGGPGDGGMVPDPLRARHHGRNSGGTRSLPQGSSPEARASRHSSNHSRKRRGAPVAGWTMGRTPQSWATSKYHTVPAVPGDHRRKIIIIFPPLLFKRNCLH